MKLSSICFETSLSLVVVLNHNVVVSGLIYNIDFDLVSYNIVSITHEAAPVNFSCKIDKTNTVKAE